MNALRIAAGILLIGGGIVWIVLFFLMASNSPLTNPNMKPILWGPAAITAGVLLLAVL